MAGIKRTPADIAFSLCIREANDWVCNRCGTKYPERARGLECSHHHGRGNWSIRFDPLNAEALCTGCHFLEGGTQIRLDACLNDEQQQILMEKKNDTSIGREIRRTKGKGEIASHYRGEYEKMREKRLDGVTGPLTFVGWM